ncbi:MAG: preprotein translocase subunit SecG [Candidatus Eisenbacteria bacterium]
MFGALLAFHILVCFSLVTVVLLQSGKGGGLAGGAFGGTAQTVFGGRGATDFLTRATMVLGALFFLTSLVLALMSTRGSASRSLLQEQARQAGATAPRVPTGQQQGPLRQGTLPQPTSTPAQNPTPAPATPSGGGK